MRREVLKPTGSCLLVSRLCVADTALIEYLKDLTCIPACCVMCAWRDDAKGEVHMLDELPNFWQLPAVVVRFDFERSVGQHSAFKTCPHNCACNLLNA